MEENKLLPIAMKVAANKIGLDLVAVKPTKDVDLTYYDYHNYNFTYTKPKIAINIYTILTAISIITNIVLISIILL